MGAIRDTNRGRIDQAEESLVASKVVREISVKEAEYFANAVAKRAWFAKQAGKATFTVSVSHSRDGTGNDCEPSSWAKTQHEILLHPRGITRLAVLHSMAHILVPHNYKEVAHSTEFVKAYLEMVRRYHNDKIDENFKKVFKKTLMACGVKTKIVSEQTREKQRAAWVKRMTPTEDTLLATLRSVEELS